MSENENGLIMLTADDGSEEAFFVLEKADIAGVSYLLVTDSIEDEEAEAMILRGNRGRTGNVSGCRR